MNFNYPYSSFSTLMSNPVVAPSNQIPFKPIAAERVSDIIGIAYNISSMDNVSVLPAPRPNEQQIFFIGNDDKIYSRTSDAGIGIVGYKQEYVQRLENELLEAQTQLFDIFNTVTQEQATVETKADLSTFDERLTRLETLLTKLTEAPINESQGSAKNVGSISELA